MSQKKREKLVEILRAIGQDLIDNAETYIPGDITWLQSINFMFGFQAGGVEVEIPSLTINTEFAQKEVLDLLIRGDNYENSKSEMG